MRLLVANFFPAFSPPSSGGEQRYYYLYRHLSRRHDVTLLSATYSDKPAELVQHSPSFREYRIPKPAVTAPVHYELYRAGIGDECSAYVLGLSGVVDSLLRSRFNELVAYADVVVHESPFTFPLDTGAGTDGRPRVYASYNVEHRLAAQMLKGEPGRTAARVVRFLEALLVDAAQLVFAISEDDRRAFVEDFDCEPAKLRLAPNGFEPAEPSNSDADAPPARADPYVVFLGSVHPPNVEAARFICESLATAVPALEFRIMGSVCSRLAQIERPGNVKLLGFVPDGEMRSQLAGCAAALNPLFSGSGTNLKMLQYMEAGAPIIATRIGARGLDLEPEVEAIICRSTEFARRLARLAAQPAMLRPLGAAARRKAYARYSWEHIAERYADDLGSLRPRAARMSRPKILVVNDFPVHAAGSGGEVRIRELVRELASDFEVTLLCLTDSGHGSDVPLGEHGLERAMPKTPEHRGAEQACDAGQLVSVRDIVAADWILRNAQFVAAFRALAHAAGLVVFEHPYLAPLADCLPPHVPVVYSSLNVEAELKKRTLAARSDAEAWLDRATEMERRIADRAAAIIAVCGEDAAAFGERFPDVPVFVVENGVREPAPWSRSPAAMAGPDERDGVVFLGSAHPPNVEAAFRLAYEFAPRLAHVTFHFVGSVCGVFPRNGLADNVLMHGVVDDERKARLLAGAALALNPMMSGGGSSLKVPDYLAAGLPLLSTRKGVRGFALRPGIEYVEADVERFPDEIERLLRDAPERARLARAGTRAVRRLVWPVLGARYRRILRSLARTRKPAQIRLLVVTYRLLSPAPGGAESYLNNLLASLGARQGIVVDVAACDVGAVHDHWHFSARYGLPPAHSGAPDGVRSVMRFPIDPPDAAAYAKCRKLFSLWMEEARAQSAELFDRLEAPLLLGGWNFPERRGEVSWRWSSLLSRIGVGSEVQAIRIEGSSPEERGVSLRGASGSLAEARVDGAFVLQAELDPARQIVDFAVDRSFDPHGDPRELGVAVNRVSLRIDGAWRDLDLSADAESVIRETDPEAWIESLIDVTQARDDARDALFLEVRGPHSQPMKSWLEEHVGDYDVVLVQGAPFAPIAWAPPIARAQAIPVLLLPHYHVQDRYYHWKGYYEAFRNADCVLAFPSSIKEQFFDRIDACSRGVAGGGIDLSEFSEERLARGREEFRKVHASSRPYVLVLGRKAAGKRYELVVDAARPAGASPRRFDVVLIGPDDDGKPLAGEGIHYYGRRSRDFILGALAECVCLVNMSESESFGIVLLEAWAAGRPVVAQSGCVAFRDLLTDGVNGYLAGTPEQVRRRVEAYVDDPALARSHGAAGRALARGYSWSSLADDVVDIIRETIFADAAPARGAVRRI